MMKLARHNWSKEQLSYLRMNYPNMTRKQLLAAFNTTFLLTITEKQLEGTLRNHGIKSGRTGRFEKGHVPFNKGLKGITTGGVATQFKKGQKPVNYKPIGSERVDQDGYILIKVADTGTWNDRWKVKQRVVWEEAYGPIPKGHVIVFLDGNKQNVRLSNLQMITKSALARMNQNGLFSHHPEATKVGINIAKVHAAIGKAKERTK